MVDIVAGSIELAAPVRDGDAVSWAHGTAEPLVRGLPKSF